MTPTDEQLRIANVEASNIIKEFEDSGDIDELRESIYEAIVEALKAQSK